MAKVEKTYSDGIRFNPKCYGNGQSATKLRTGESSTTIPLTGSTAKGLEAGKPKQVMLWERDSLCLMETSRRFFKEAAWQVTGLCKRKISFCKDKIAGKSLFPSKMV